MKTLDVPQSPEFLAALTRESIARARQFVAGIRAYQNHPAWRDRPDAPIVWRKGNTRLREYVALIPNAPTVLVIPSLVNRYTILDLDRGQSFAQFLAGAGFRTLVVDWSDPDEDEKKFTLTDYVTRRLEPLLAFIGTAHVMGYCMGGLLALALATLRPKATQTLTLIATPWDFHQPDASLGDLARVVTPDIEKTLSASGLLPVDAIQSLFAFQQPFQAVGKFMGFAAMDQAGAEARRFVLLEDWLNEGVPLAGPVARECLADWYGGNLPARGLWRIAGMLMDPARLAMPSYVIVPDKDRIVPPESSRPLARLLPHATCVTPALGHIGLMASRTASERVWQPLIEWLRGKGEAG